MDHWTVIIGKLSWEDLIRTKTVCKWWYKMVKRQIESIRAVTPVPTIWDPSITICHNLISEFYNTDLSIPLQELEDMNAIDLNEVPNFYKELKRGDTIDFEGYRGIGLYYFDGNTFIKTTGIYGYYLPSDAWEFIKILGPDTYLESGAMCVRIPNKVITKPIGQPVTEIKDAAMEFEGLMSGDYEYGIIDGIKYYADVFEYEDY